MSLDFVGRDVPGAPDIDFSVIINTVRDIANIMVKFPQRKRHRLEHFDYSTKEYPYFITICCSDKQRLFTDDIVARTVQKAIEYKNAEGSAAIFCYTIMPDHLHILLSLTSGYDGTLQSWASSFKSYSARLIISDFGIDKVWQAISHEHVVRKEESLLDITNYKMNNPVRQGLADSWEDYPYSGMLSEFP